MNPMNATLRIDRSNHEKSHDGILGVLGGMGPLASAEFMKTIYELSLGTKEQLSPRVLMYSDPTMPDRTEMLLQGKSDELCNRLQESVQLLSDMGATRVLICCMTIHRLLPLLPKPEKEKIISLLDLLFDELYHTPGEYLLLATRGTIKLNLLADHPLWEAVKLRVSIPSEDDLEEIHEIIYEIKKCTPISPMVPRIMKFLDKYGKKTFIAGCTELHMLAKHPAFHEQNKTGYGCVDPLMIAVKSLIQGNLISYGITGKT
jgi:aspartate racemase